MKIYKALVILAMGFSAFYGFAQEITNPYNPKSKMELLKAKNEKGVKNMHFLVFGNSLNSEHFPMVLKRADSLQPDFCLSTGSLIGTYGGKDIGKSSYKKLDKTMGWFLKKYPFWPVAEYYVGLDDMDSTVKQNYSNFYGIEEGMYSFKYGNAVFISLPWSKLYWVPENMEWLENELKKAKGKHIFIFKIRPHYTLGYITNDIIEGVETSATKLFDKYKVTAVFAGFDRLYYRTKRKKTTYFISSGAGAPTYKLMREKEALDSDSYYGGRNIKEQRKDPTLSSYKFRESNGKISSIENRMYYVLSIKIEGNKVFTEVVDAATGKVWDKTRIK